MEPRCGEGGGGGCMLKMLPPGAKTKTKQKQNSWIRPCFFQYADDIL